MMAHKPDIRRLVTDRDLDGLVEALRYPGDAGTRARAASALGKLGKTEAVEGLMRSYLQDPDPGAQQAALEALHQIIGGEAELAISAYAPPDEPWIEEIAVPVEIPGESDSGEEEFSDEEDTESDDEDDLEDLGELTPEAGEGEATIWDENDIQALLSAVRLDHSRKKRLRAIQALSQIPNTRAVDALASIALWSEEKWLREASREALSAIYGDSLDEVLQSYREGRPEAGPFKGDEGDDDELEDEEDDEDEDEDDVDFDDEEDEDDDEDEEEGEEADAGSGEEQSYPPAGLTRQSPPPIREEKTGWVTYLLFGLLLLAVLAGVIYLLAR
jgi:hypothetical protein